MHLSWGHPRRALPVILALWSPDFPHLDPFGFHPRLSGLVAEILYRIRGQLSNVLQNLFERDILKKIIRNEAFFMNVDFESYFRSLRGKKIAVLGLGVSNRPLVRLLLEFGCDVLGCDRTPRESLDQEVLDLEKAGCRLSLGDGYLENIRADVVFRTPGMHPGKPEIQALKAAGAVITSEMEEFFGGAVITSEMEEFFELCPCHIIGITGSDGKTTTTTLVSEILKAAGKTVWLGGNIGAPLLPNVRQMKPEDYAVVELSSFQLMDMKRSPEIAVVTNLAPNHLDVHRDMQEYVDAKKNIFLWQSGSGRLILNADNDITKEFRGNGEILFFSRRQQTNGVWAEDGVIYRHAEPVLKVDEIFIPGVHNVENYMAAILAVEGLVPDEAIRKVAREFGGVEGRMEFVRNKDGVKYYNDSMASSPSRTICGLNCYQEKVLLIAGGYDKHIPYEPVAPYICRHVKKLYLNGATAGLIRRAVESCELYDPSQLEIFDCGTLEPAIRAAHRDAREGDVVLLSPASASFDQFKNFVERGRFFKRIVKEL